MTQPVKNDQGAAQSSPECTSALTPVERTLVEKSIAEIGERFPDWTPTDAMLGYARAVAKLALAYRGSTPDRNAVLPELPNLGAIDALRLGQQQLDMHGEMVGVSRQALDELLDWFDKATGPTVEAALTTTLEPKP